MSNRESKATDVYLELRHKRTDYEKSVKSSLNVSDILPNVRGREAILASGLKEDVKLYDSLNELDQLLDMAFAGKKNPFSARIKKIERDATKDAEDYLSRVRQWARLVYKELRATAPVFTGNLRDSIRFMGTGYNEINVGIDPDVISQEGETTTKRKYVYPEGSKNAGRVIRRGTVRQKPGFDYSTVADFIAKTSNRGVGGKFKFSTWYKFKKQKATELGLKYTKDVFFDVLPLRDEDMDALEAKKRK